MTIRFYSSLDVDAPALPSVPGQRSFDNLRIVLKACLVDGYGAKPAAGWTIGHEHADGISFGNGEGFVNLVHSTHTNGVLCYIMEAVTDGSTAFAGGVNRRSGPWYDGSTSTVRQWFNIVFSGTSTNKGWVVVADDKTVTLFVQATSSVDPQPGEAATIHFGRYYPYIGGNGFVLAAGGGGVYSNNDITSWYMATNYSWSVLRNPFTGLADQGLDPVYRGLFRGPISVTINPKPVSRTLQLTRVPLLTSGLGTSGSTLTNAPAWAGVLRGIMYDPFLCTLRFSQLWPLLGGATPVTPQDRLETITVAGKEVWPSASNVSESNFFVSLDPVDWGPLWS